MKILNVTDSEFEEYGYVISLKTDKIVEYLNQKSQMPKENTLYVRDDLEFKSLDEIKVFKEKVFGNGDIEVGYCNGYNSYMNCMEYHSCPEVDIAANDLVLLLALKRDIKGGILNSKDVKAFLLKKGEAVCLYPYTLHFAPCQRGENGFKSAIILADKTNMDLTTKPEDKSLWKVNKWLLAHKDSKQASLGAYIGIVGDNLKVER